MASINGEAVTLLQIQLHRADGKRHTEGT